MKDLLIRLKVILNLTAQILKGIGMGFGIGFLVLFIIGVFANFIISWAITGMACGFGIFFVGHIIQGIINYESR